MADDFIDIGTLSLAAAPRADADGFPDLATAPSGAAAYVRVNATVRPLTGYPAPASILSAEAADNSHSVIADEAPAPIVATAEPAPHPVRTGNADEHVAAWAHLFGSTVVLPSALTDLSAGVHTDILSPDQFLEAPVDAASGVDALLHAAASTSLDAALYGEMRAALDDVLAAAGLPAVVAATPPQPPTAQSTAARDEDFHAAPMRTVVRVAVCQVHAVSGDPLASVHRIARILEASQVVSNCKADVYVFPETFLGGYHLGATALHGIAQPLPSPDAVAAAVAAHELCSTPLLAAAQLAARHGVALVLPFVERGTTPDVRNPSPSLPPLYNSVVVIDSDGGMRLCYRKCHLWGAAYEQRLFTAGPGPCPTRDPFHPFTLRAWPDLLMGVLVCFDNEFSEPARMLALRGCKLVFAVMASGDVGGFSPTCMFPVRAAENHMAYAYCNYPSSPPPAVAVASPSVVHFVPSEGIEVSYSGGSAVFAPTGRPITAAPVYACSPSKRGAPQAVLDSLYVRDDSERDAMRRLRTELGAALAEDEHVLLAQYDAVDPQYVVDEARNPYLMERRTDLYSLL